MNLRTFIAGLFAIGYAFVDFSWGYAATRNVKNYGAKGNGTADDTTAIRNAIAACQPGDTLQFPAGTYKVTGVIKPKSDMTLDFLGGAKLVQAGNAHLMFFDHVSNVTTFNMRLRHNSNARTSNPLRIDGADNCTLNDTLIERTDAWNVYLLGGSHHIRLDGMTIQKGRTGNIDDGVDFAECHDCWLLDFDIHTNDDAVSFKSYNNVGGTHHITVQNGKLQSDQAAPIGFGTEIDTDLYAILVDDVEIVGSLHGVYFRLTDSARAGNLSDIEIRNITHNAPLVAPWPQNFVFVQKYDTLNRTANISIHDYTYVGEPYDGIHVMRASGFTLSNITATVPNNDSRWSIWLEDADNNSFSLNMAGFTNHANIDALSTGNTLAGVY